MTDPEAKGNLIVSVQFLGIEAGTGTFNPISGVLSSTATAGQFNGTLPLAGLVRLCLFSTDCTAFGGLPLTTVSTGGNTVGVGIGGLLTFTIFSGFARLSVQANPWSIKTVTAIDQQTTPVNSAKVLVPITFKGFAHGPASGTTNTADIGGVVQLVSASQITSNLPTGSNDKIASGQSLLIKSFLSRACSCSSVPALPALLCSAASGSASKEDLA